MAIQNAKKPSSGKNTAQKKPAKSSSSPKTAKSTASRPRSSTAASTKTKAASQAQNVQPQKNPNPLFLSIAPAVITILALYIVICFIMPGANDKVGGVGWFIRSVFFGLFSFGAWIVPLLLANIIIFMRRDYDNDFIGLKAGFSILCIILFSSLSHLFSVGTAGFDVGKLFTDGMESKGGGVIGGILASVLISTIGTVGAGIVIITLLLLFTIFLFGLTPLDLVRKISASIKSLDEREGFERKIVVKDQRSNIPFSTKTHTYRIVSHTNNQENPSSSISAAKVKLNKKALREKNPFANDLKNAEKPKSEVPKILPDSEVYEKIASSGESLFIHVKTDEDKVKYLANFGESGLVDKGANFDSDKIIEQAVSDDEFVDISCDNVKNNGENIEIGMLESVESAPVARGDEPELGGLNVEKSKLFPDGESSEPLYKFPPITFLTAEIADNNVDVSEELTSTATKLVDTLTSFGVKTKISAYSRGPSITRYELSPNSGVRVRSIVTLVDDISLNLATGGVRIEAPIPGKDTVGIEVPNKVVSTVHLRSLIEDTKFTQAKSPLTIVLGKDVAGNPIYSDIAKMPHCLIAGATGMGKSVCINSIITSLLYKAKPTDVKLILVDPKKVELNIYNGIPHLLVPVVSDPRKAAGSLAWAVNEMERRYTLIEEMGVRDIDVYNETTAGDIEHEHIPHIVIIIDELADLMMTAPSDVEVSIARLTAKARAAGIHIIIGTQRPSVDVITGLIKANIPSRIAFTTASQIDSRTIIDIGGAEKLIGRGDMLYLPVGTTKPIRVQGAYISEKDVHSVTDFLRKQHTGEYDQSIVRDIEIAASNTNTKGAKIQTSDGKSESEEEQAKDTMLRPAIEIAVEVGTVSTSLLQRRLSIGYGRAAKLIDIMERMNVVSPPDGQKARRVLITRQDFVEMMLGK